MANEQTTSLSPKGDAKGMMLSPRQKAAIFIMSLPPELSAQVIRSFPPEEVQSLTLEMAKVPAVPESIKKSVVDEFLLNPELELGPSPAPSIKKSIEEERREPHVYRKKPLAFLMRADPRQVYLLIGKEHPQTIALVLSFLIPSQATKVLEEIKPPIQSEVARRLADVGKVRPDVLHDLESTLEENYYHLMDEGFQDQNGKDALMEILSRSERSTEEKILSGLARKNPTLAKSLKNQLCEFEDIAFLSESDIGQLLKVTDMRDLVLALKGAAAEITEKIYSSVSPERANAIRDDVLHLKVTDWDDIRIAQQRVRNNLRGLVIIGKIKVSANGE